MICLQPFEICDPPVPVGRKGLQTLTHFSDVRKDEALHQHLADKGEATPMGKVLVHGTCRKRYTDGRKAKVEFLEETPPPKRLRSSTPRPFQWKTDCLFCGMEAIIDIKHPEREVIMSVRTLSIRETISAQCGSRSDPWSIEILTRLENCIDFVSEEALYHRTCYVKFMCTSLTSKPVGRPVDDGMGH